jgi:hypothetical protein
MVATKCLRLPPNQCRLLLGNTRHDYVTLMDTHVRAVLPAANQKFVCYSDEGTRLDVETVMRMARPSFRSKAIRARPE